MLDAVVDEAIVVDDEGVVAVDVVVLVGEAVVAA